MTDTNATASKRHVNTWTEFTTQQKVIFALIVPLVLGVIAGLCLGWNAIAYLVMQILICILAFLSGTEHVGALPGALRAANGGLWFGTAIWVTDSITGWEETVALPHHWYGLIALTAGVGAILGAWGGSKRAKAQLGAQGS